MTIIYLEFSPEYSTKESSTLISSVRVIFVVESCRGYSQHVTITAPDVTTWSVKDIPSLRKATVKPDIVGGVKIHLITCYLNTRLE